MVSSYLYNFKGSLPSFLIHYQLVVAFTAAVNFDPSPAT